MLQTRDSARWQAAVNKGKNPKVGKAIFVVGFVCLLCAFPRGRGWCTVDAGNFHTCDWSAWSAAFLSTYQQPQNWDLLETIIRFLSLFLRGRHLYGLFSLVFITLLFRLSSINLLIRVPSTVQMLHIGNMTKLQAQTNAKQQICQELRWLSML